MRAITGSGDGDATSGSLTAEVLEGLVKLSVRREGMDPDLIIFDTDDCYELEQILYAARSQAKKDGVS